MTETVETPTLPPAFQPTAFSDTCLICNGQTLKRKGFNLCPHCDTGCTDDDCEIIICISTRSTRKRKGDD